MSVCYYKKSVILNINTSSETLTLKTRLTANPFLWKWILLHQNLKTSFYEWLPASPRSETEAWGQLSACESLLGKCIHAHSLIPASYPDVSLSMKMYAQRKAGRRQRASPAVCTLPMVPCGSSPVTRHSRFALASALRKTKRLRRRLLLYQISLPDHIYKQRRQKDLGTRFATTKRRNIEAVYY